MKGGSAVIAFIVALALFIGLFLAVDAALMAAQGAALFYHP